MIIKATLNVNNMNNMESGWLVVRDCDGELWYFGNYDTAEKAELTAKVIGNGIVIRYDGNKQCESQPSVETKEYDPLKVWENIVTEVEKYRQTVCDKSLGQKMVAFETINDLMEILVRCMANERKD